MANQDQYPHEAGGMSTAGKLILGCGIGCGVLCLLCCGLVAGVVWLGFEYIPRTFSELPERIQETAAKIATIDVPATLQPKAAVDLAVPFTSQPLTTLVVYADGSDEQVLAMAELAGPFESSGQQWLRQQIDEVLTGDGKHADHDDFQVRQSRDIDVEVRGQTVRFRIEEGDNHGRKQVRAKGQFPGHRGTAVLFLQLDADDHGTDQVERILHSIR